MSSSPRSEVALDEATVRSLLEQQGVDRCDEPLRRLDEGWDNELWRLGDRRLVRLPRRSASAQLQRVEQRWLPTLAENLPIPITAPLFCGQPSEIFPWVWSVVPYFAGTPASLELPIAPSTPDRLGEFLVELHRPAPSGAPTSPYRGVPLDDRDARVRECLRSDALTLDAESLAKSWEAVLTTPRWEGPAVWVHGDLHPSNIVVRDGRIVAIIDFGDLCAGDPAVDLAVGWMLFDSVRRESFRRCLGVDDATWRRGAGWAITLGLMLHAECTDRPELVAAGTRALTAVMADPLLR
jgi:aminoglycoside phosphotransferase (APT) family kinase protein